VSTTAKVARFGVFEFDPDTLELRRQGVRVAIEPQPARALALLLRSAGEIVSRDDLKQALWKGDVHVDFDRGLAYVMSQVRSALGDTADNPRFIETLPKRGFRFIAPLSPISVPPVQSVPTVPPLQVSPPARRVRGLYGVVALALTAAVIAALVIALSAKRPVLAVAIFDNETGQPQYDRFTAGMADAVIGRLATLDVNRMGVVGNARTLRMPRSERDLNEIKSETGASFILISVLQSREAGISLLTQLISLDDGTHVWVKRFDRAAGNLDGLEAEVLAEVEKGVRLRVIDGVPKAAPSSTPSANR